jgi:RHS repeat-associated protein
LAATSREVEASRVHSPNAVTYDALGRMVEQNKSGSYTEIVYDCLGNKLALMNGTSTLVRAFVALPAGATAVYNASGLLYYRHPDWLGSSRFSSTTSRTMYNDLAYAPFGEQYAQSGNTGVTDTSFAGNNEDTATNLYDAMYREYGIQGRWPSPDPAGIAAAIPANPQSWNRYAYALNRPTDLTDPLGTTNASKMPRIRISAWGCDPYIYYVGGPCDNGGGAILDLLMGGGGPPAGSGPGNGSEIGLGIGPQAPPQQTACSARIQAAVQSDLNPTSLTNLGPTSGPGLDSNGMRGGAYNINFFETGVTLGPPGTATAIPGATCGRFGDGLHIPIPGAPGCPDLNDPTIFTGEPALYNGMSGFFFTAHIDSGNANTFFGAIRHFFEDVVLGNLGFHHGC